MLPDYPKVKERLVQVYMNRLKAVHNTHLSLFAETPVFVMHEGNRNVLNRDDGSIDDSLPSRLEANAILNFDVKKPEQLTSVQIAQFLDDLAENFAEEKFKMFLASINEAVEKVGNVVDSNKNGVEAFLDMTEKRQLDFDDNDKPIQPQLLAGSVEVVNKFKEAIRQIEGTPALRQRFEAIIEKKRTEWRDRENARNLVE